MSGRRKEIAAERVAEGRRFYKNTLTPVREIAVRRGISRNTLDSRGRSLEKVARILGRK